MDGSENKRQTDFQDWTDAEVQQEYKNLSRGGLTPEEKQLKQKLKTELKARGLRRSTAQKFADAPPCTEEVLNGVYSDDADLIWGGSGGGLGFLSFIAAVAHAISDFLKHPPAVPPIPGPVDVPVLVPAAMARVF